MPGAREHAKDQRPSDELRRPFLARFARSQSRAPGALPAAVDERAGFAPPESFGGYEICMLPAEARGAVRTKRPSSMVATASAMPA